MQVSYDGEVLKRIQYRVRPLPTLISGGLTDQFFQPIAGMVVEIPALGRSSITNKDGNFSFGFGDSADANIAGGEYEIIFNPDMRNPKYGSNALKLMVDQGRHNSLVIQKVPVLNQDVNFTPVRNGQSVSLLNGALKFDLTQADLRMPDNRLSGVIHAQFTARSQSIYRYGYFAYANWLYTVQPHGVRILGSLENLDLELPLLNNARTYIPENSEYVLLLGLDPESNTITATGVGLINGSRVQSVGKLEYKSLNVFSIAVVPSKYEEKLKAYAEGEIDFASLTRELHIMEDEIRNFDENTQVIGQ